MSSTPGEAIKQSPRLARIVLGTADRFPAGDPVNLEFIGHSEGTVVNTYAIVKLSTELTPELKSGFIEDTLLDPHAANNDIVSGKQMSFAGPLAGLAQVLVTDYQGEAKDPPAYFPSIVNEANVFYEHTPATATGIYNLWGQVPVKSDGPLVHYYNLTASGVTHSGNTGVPEWYRNFIVPTLGNQAPLVQELQLNGRIDGAQRLRPRRSPRPAAGPWCGRPTRYAPTVLTDPSKSSRPADRSSPARPRPARRCDSTWDRRRSPRRLIWPA